MESHISVMIISSSLKFSLCCSDKYTQDVVSTILTSMVGVVTHAKDHKLSTRKGKNIHFNLVTLKNRGLWYF